HCVLEDRRNGDDHDELWTGRSCAVPGRMPQHTVIVDVLVFASTVARDSLIRWPVRETTFGGRSAFLGWWHLGAGGSCERSSTSSGATRNTPTARSPSSGPRARSGACPSPSCGKRRSGGARPCSPSA